MLGNVILWGGAIVTMAGVLGLVHCGRLSMQARTLPEAEAKTVMERVLWINVAAMGTAVLGLMAVIVGLILR